MADLPSDPDAFVIESPVWTIAIDAELRAHGMPGGVAVMASAGHGLVFPLYTDEDLARRFLEESGAVGRSPYRIDGLPHLVALLRAMELVGVNRVGIDCPTAANPRGEAGRYPTVRQVLAAAGAG